MMQRTAFFLALFAAAFMSTSARAEDIAPEDLEFFENRIRPVLVEHCYECHNSADLAEGGLALDAREPLLAGGDGGPIVSPGNPEQSRLLAVLRHEIDGLEMPQGGGKLDEAVIADFARWIAAGAPDPRDEPPSLDDLAAAISWEATLERRKSWWSFQPIRRLDPPAGDAKHPIDRFIDARLAAEGLTASPPAVGATLLRRLYFAVIGLPPDAEAVARWTPRLTADRNDAVEELVDELLASDRFGERWARHWMDWIRYAESHGSEGDPEIHNAWLYRDYLIRALNTDVPYDQLVREHIAGDLLEEPRVNEELGLVESRIGPAHWRMVFHGFAPTDALDEKVRFTDDQINAFSKAFLGITVSCARCHDHKFDAVSQSDYYALFGILGSCRPGRAAIDMPERLNRNRDELAALKRSIRQALADDWVAALPAVEASLASAEGPWQAAENADRLLYPLRRLREQLEAGTSFQQAWQACLDDWQADVVAREKFEAAERWNLAADEDYDACFPHGRGLPEKPSAAGEFAVAPAGDLALTGVFPAGVYSHLISQKHPARLTSADFEVGDDQALWVQTLGEGGAALRYVVQNFPRDGTVYPVTKLSGDWAWRRFDLTYWQGDAVHWELTAGRDAPLLVNDQERSWFGVRAAVLAPKGGPSPPESREYFDPLFAAAEQEELSSWEDLPRLYVEAISSAVAAWRNGAATDAQALLIDRCLREGVLPNQLDQLPSARPLVAEYRRLEDEIPAPTRVPGLDETVGRDQPLFVRGDHRRPAEPTPRRFLEAIDDTPYATNLSGRRELAEDVLRDDNPLARRVIVNRVWHHLFGRGLVATPDNFGRLGQLPSHPELLDWLAVRFVEDGWSLKRLIRLVATSQAWQRSSLATEEQLQRDPDNLFLARANVRRLEAEAIRDSLLAVSGRLDSTPFGPPVRGDAPRRSVYVRVVRNSLDPFLRAFDFPEPVSTVGRRDATNVPAQSLTMLNDPSVAEDAAAWVSRLFAEAAATGERDRIACMFVDAFGRPPTEAEAAGARDYLAETRGFHHELRAKSSDLRRRLAKKQSAAEQLLAPIRARLEQEAGATPQQGTIPQPIARWDFEAADSRVELHDGARLEDGALVVDGGYAMTTPLERDLAEKTLEAWVQLDDLGQAGGGVVSLQSRDGGVFDAIVYGEQEPGRWLAGSNFFTRTRPFGGPAETEADSRPVHVAVAYHADGKIVGYRDGRPYGEAYASDGPQSFLKGESVVTFGLRHLPANGGRLLSGRIFEARLYDRALTDMEAAATAAADRIVTEAEVLAALGEQQREQVDALRADAARLQAELDSFGQIPADGDERAAWIDLARAMFLFEEFIYVR